MAMTDDDCRSFVPAIRYELLQLADLTVVMRAHMNDPIRIVRNALLESLLLKVRLVDEFMADKKRFDDDVRASDYVRVSVAPVLTELERVAINKRLAHLTTRRATENEEWNWWDLATRTIRCYQDRFLPLVQIERPGLLDELASIGLQACLTAGIQPWPDAK